MSKLTKILILLGLGGIAFYFLARNAAAQTTAKPSGLQKILAAGAGVAGVVSKGVAAVKSILGLGGASATATAGGTTAAGVSAAATTSGVTAGTGAATAGAGAGATALAPAGALASFAAVALAALAPVLNLFGWFSKEPEWHKEWRESGGLAEWEATMKNTEVLSYATLPKGTFAGKSIVPPADLGGPTAEGVK